MANAQNLLEAAKKQKENGGMTQQPQQQRRPAPQQMMESVMAVSSDLGSLENLYFNPQEQDVDPLTEAYEVYPNGQRRKLYDAHEDMKEMANFNIKNVQSNMPKAILESMMTNPLNMPTEGMEYNSGEIMDESLQNRTMDIIDKLENRDRQGKPGRPQYQPQYQQKQQPMMDMTYLNESYEPQAPAVDYKQLAQLIEHIIDKKFAQYSKGMLNEGKGQNGTTLSFVKLGDTFTFMDSANNVYECKMVYKGKGKVKKN